MNLRQVVANEPFVPLSDLSGDQHRVDERITSWRFARSALESTARPLLRASRPTIFAQVCSACLTHRLDSFFDRARGARVYRRLLLRKTRIVKTPYVAGVFNESEKFAHDGARSRLARRPRSSKRNMRCGRAIRHAALSENAGFFVAL
jgi:hypothetical protein